MTKSIGPLVGALVLSILCGCTSTSELHFLQRSHDELSLRVSILEKELIERNKKIEAAFLESRSAYDVVEGTKGQVDELARQLDITHSAIDEIILKIKNLKSSDKEVKEETLSPTVADFEGEFTRVSRRLSKLEVFLFDLKESRKNNLVKSVKQPASTEAFTKKLYSLFKEKKYQIILDETEKVLHAKNALHLQEVAMLFRAEAFFATSDYKHSSIVFLNLLEDFPKSTATPRVLLLLGDCFVNLKKIRTAKSFYLECVDLFPEQKECIASKKRLEAMS